MNRFLLWIGVLGAAVPVCDARGALPVDVTEALARVATYEEGQTRKAVIAVEQYVARSTGAAAARTEIAEKLAETLKKPGTTPAARTFLCRQLALVGTDTEVPLLASMLDDPAQAADAVYALQAIESDTAGAALRAALDRCKGTAQAGVAAALGQRRDTKAVAGLSKLAQSRDPSLATSAVAALGNIGTTEAFAALDGVPGAEAVDARLKAAIRMSQAGAKPPPAFFASLMAQDQAASVRLSALAACAQVQPDEVRKALPRLVDDADVFVASAAIRLAGGMNDGGMTSLLIEAMKKADSPRKVVLLDVLAARKDGAALKEVVALANDADETVRDAALCALGRLGTAETVPVLARVAAGGTGKSKIAAEQALLNLSAPGVDEAILEGLAAGSDDSRIAMIAAAGARQPAGGEARLVDVLAGGGNDMQIAAARALARIGSLATYPKLVDAMTTAASADVRAEIRKAVIAVGRRIDKSDDRVKPVLSVIRKEGLPPGTAAALYGVLSGIGGEAALVAVREGAAAKNPTVRTAAIKALSEWPEATALPDLIKSLGDTTEAPLRSMLMDGLVRMIPAGPQPLKTLDQTRALLKGDAEKKQWLAAAGGVAEPRAMELAVGMALDPAVAGEAAAAALKIGQKLEKSHPAWVMDAVGRLLPQVKDEAMAASLKELQKSAKTLVADRERARQNSSQRRAALAKEIKTGRLLAYLDCGPESETGSPEGVLVKAVNGGPYTWKDGIDVAGAPAATVLFDAARVAFEISGLDPKKSYAVGLTWWDFDNNGRKQSVWISGLQVIPETALPAWQTKSQKPAQLVMDVPTAAIKNGKVVVDVRREGDNNAVVSELWVVENNGGPAAATPTAPVPLTPAAAAPGQKKILIVTGRDYPGHKWQLTTPVLKNGIAGDSRLFVTVSEDPAVLGSPDLKTYDAIVLNYMNWEDPGPGAAAQENFRKAVENGAGLVLVHFSCGAFQGWPEFVKMAGRVWNPKLRGHDPHGTFRVNVIDPSHPVTKGIASFDTVDELYTCLDGDTPVQILATSRSKVDGKDYPMAFTLRYGKGRVFHCVLGHDVKALPEPVTALYRRGVAWAAGLEP